jgi:hypothetical protein
MDSEPISKAALMNSLHGEHISQDVRTVLAKVADLIQQQQNREAARLFECFTEELNKPAPQKATLAIFWSGLVTTMPAVSNLLGVTKKIEGLYSVR